MLSRYWCRYRALPSPQRRDLWGALWRLLLVRALMVFGVHRTRRMLAGTRCLQAGAVELDALKRWQERALALKRVGHRLPGVHCLARSLALRWWMRSSGVDVRLIMGARRSQGVLDSHSWLEWAGVPVDEAPEVTRGYQVFCREGDATEQSAQRDPRRNG